MARHAGPDGGETESLPVAVRELRDAIVAGDTALGIELGSTRIKACLIDSEQRVVATGAFDWENQLVDGLWSYPLDEVWTGLQACLADLMATIEAEHGVRPTRFGSLGISAMMHGYLAFNSTGDVLVPFRTWRNTNTGPAAERLSAEFGYTIPLRWSGAHLYQAMLNGEGHVGEIAYLTTLAGYVHWQLTGEKVLGVGDASGMFPIDPATRTYDAALLTRFDELAAEFRSGFRLESVMPRVLVAGQNAGTLTEAGARLLDPSGTLESGIAMCPPEGDAGTGMVATNAVAPRTGNVSVGTSIFAMVVLERPLSAMYPEIDLVTTPAGDLVAMVHCNNGASEFGEWAGLFRSFAQQLGHTASSDDVFGALLTAALEGAEDGGGLLAYNYLAGEPITGLEAGRPLVVRTPDSQFSLANFARTQVYGVFATLSLGMELLEGENVAIDAFFAHGGLFRTAGVGQRLLAAAVNTPVAVAETASEGGAWGIAVLAAFERAVSQGQFAHDLGGYLTQRVFADTDIDVIAPDPADVAGYASYLERYRSGLAIERAAIESI